MKEKISFEIPFERFTNWFEEAVSKPEIIEPNAMCLSTVDKNHKPSSRMVLLKKFDERGFCFYTNLTSRKAQELTQNPNVALCFYWGILGFQVRIEGAIEKVTEKEADEYFASRRRESRIGAWASKQSSEMKEWLEFEERIKEVEKNFEGKDVTRPEFWSGFRVVPNRIEFWQEGDFRIHKREVYFLNEDKKSWKLKKLYP